jgi:hypothetical protein
MPHEPGHGEPVSPYVEQVTEAREQREAIRRKTRRLPWLAVLATIAVIFGGGWAAAGLINVDNQADETSATLADIEGERRVRSIYNAEAVVRACSNDNRQADYNDFLLNELVKGANRDDKPATDEEKQITRGLRKGIDALREDCREAPIVARTLRAYPDAAIPGIRDKAASGERTIPYVPLH